MKQLFLIRHAKASHDIPSIRDMERPLTERGYHDAALVSGQLIKEFTQPAFFVSSPAARAFSTALVFAATFKVREDSVLLDNRLYDSSVSDYLDVIRELPAASSAVFLFGHNEVISETAFKLLKDPSVESMRTSGVVWILSEAPTWIEFASAPCACELQLYPALIKDV